MCDFSIGVKTPHVEVTIKSFKIVRYTYKLQIHYCNPIKKSDCLRFPTWD